MRIEGRGARPSASSTRASCFPRWPPPIMPTFRPWLPSREVGKASSVPLGLGKQRSWCQPSGSHVCPDHLQSCPPGRVPCHESGQLVPALLLTSSPGAGVCSTHGAQGCRYFPQLCTFPGSPRDTSVLSGPTPDRLVMCLCHALAQ